MKVSVVGASGFVGRQLCPLLSAHGFDVTAVVREPGSGAPFSEFVIGDIASTPNWSQGLAGVNVVVHLAARVHVMNDESGSPLREYRKVNTDSTMHLAKSAVAAGVQRFIYLSTIKVLGEQTGDQPFGPDDPPAPVDPYALSKYEAEQRLAELGRQSGMEIVIIRPPLVYGPGVGGNVLTAFDLVTKGYPLPLGMIHNKRSMVSVSNLCDLIMRTLDHPGATGRPLLVADGEDLSTGEFFKLIGQSLDRSARVFPVPEFLLKGGGAILGRLAAIGRLTQSLQVDASATCTRLDWQPPMTPDDEMTRTAQWYLQQRDVQ